MATCFRCGGTFPREIRVTRTEECPQCNQPVRCCRNCRFYAPGAHWDCHETIPEQVIDKERANFCEYFRLNDHSDDTGSSGNRDSDTTTRRAFDDLFS